MMVKQQTLERLNLIVLTIAGIAGVILAGAIPFTSGVGWDAPFEIEWGSLVASAGSTPSDVAELRRAVPTQDLSKGPQLFWLAAAIGQVTPLPEWNPDIYTASSYVLLGLASTLIALVGPLFFAIALRMVTGSSLVGVASFALIATTPLWLGMSSIDFRDIHVASGLTAFSAGLLLLATRPTHRRPWLYSGLIFIALGALVAVAGRAGSVILLGFLGAWGIAILTMQALMRNSPWSRVAASSALLVMSTLAGMALAVAMHPIGRAEPIAWLTEAVVFASDNPNVMLVRVLGQNITSDQAPWWYVPAWLLAQLPIITLVMCGIGAATWLIQRWRTRCFSAPGITALILFGQAVVLPIVILLARPNIYDGIRHFLFILPPLLALIVLSILRIRWRFSVPLVVLGVVLSLFASARWFPYSYAFVNPVAGAVKSVRVWEYDFWGLSAHAGIDQLKELGAERVFIRPGSRSSVPFGGEEFDAYLNSPDSDVKWGGLSFLRWDAELPPECAQEFEITRDGIPLLIGGMCS